MDTQEDNKPFVRVVFEHYRIPASVYDTIFVKKGQPPVLYLVRDSKGKSLPGRPFSNRGGKTVCKIMYQKGILAMGESVCSLSDNFSRATGREIALTRAFDNLFEFLPKLIDSAEPTNHVNP